MTTNSKEIGIYKKWRIFESRKDKRCKPLYIAYFRKYENSVLEMLYSEKLEDLKEQIDKKDKRQVVYSWKH